MNKNDFENYYQILGLPDFASIEEVKKAFRELAKKHHPDRGGDPEKFKKILKAYKILSDKEKKKQFDEYLFTFKSKRRNKEYKEKTEGNESINFIPLKETPILNKIKNIVLASIFFIIPFIMPQLLLLAKNKTITFEALILGFIWGLIVCSWNILLGLYTYLFINGVLGNFFKKIFIHNNIIKIIALIIILVFFIIFDFLISNQLVNGDLNKSKKTSQEKLLNYNKNFSLSKTEEIKTISYDEAIKNYWDDIKGYINGYTTIEACSDSGCYDLEAHISNGKIDEIYFPNGGYLYFDADINSYGQASDMDQNGNWWDFSIGMYSSIINDAVSDWASDNGFEIY
jgi:hypothetical protein